MEIFLILIVILIMLDYKENQKIKSYWKDWHNNSFEHKGMRFNKDIFYLDNGEIKMKENK